MSKTTAAVVVALSAFVLSSPSADGNPGSKDIDAGIDVHGKEVAGPIQARAQSLYEDGNAALISFVEAANKGRLARLAVKPMGQAHVKLTQSRRLGGHLKLLGEMSGNDYERRASYLLSNLDDLIVRYRSLSTSRNAVDQIRRALQKQAAARNKQLLKLQKLAVEKKWTAAEDELYRMLDTLEPATVFLSNEEQKRIYAPFGEVRSVIESAMYQFRGRKGQEHLAQRLQQQMPDLTGILAEISAAPDGLASSGKATSGGLLLSGPELVTDFGNRWQEVQVAILRCRALEWVTRGNNMEADYPDGSSQADSRIAADYLRFSQSMYPAFARLIEADATRVSDAEAVRLYVQYLTALAPLIRRSVDLSLGAAVSPAMQKLAARASQFPTEIAAYEDATGDLLRWRRRVAMARAKSEVARYEAVETKFFSATQSREGYIGLFPQRDANPLVATLSSSAPQVLPQAIERLQGRNVSVVDIVRLPNNGKASVARYRRRTYVNLPAPLDLQAEVDALKYDLLISEEAPAITLQAALAIDTAERGDLAAAGGEIVNLYLESVVTRFAALPTAASVLTPLGTIPVEQGNYSFLNQVLMRFDLRPHWVQHDYFFLLTDARPMALGEQSESDNPRTAATRSGSLPARPR